jgi:acetyl-CoA carboxylase biotin carboxyl carrier protein
MDIAELKKLVRLMNENELVELEIQEQGATVRLKKAPPPTILTAAAAHLMAPASPPAPAAGATTPAAPAAPAGPPPGTEEIRSPIVGTFYRSAAPEAPAFVNVGDRVRPDSVVCIVEAMKVMNEIKAEKAGEVVEVLVENGQAVEFDQPLFRIRVE